MGAALGGVSLFQPRRLQPKHRFPQHRMPRRPFWRSGIMVSALSLGGCSISSQPLDARQALEWGIDYWDTAEGTAAAAARRDRALVCRRPKPVKRFFWLPSFRRAGHGLYPASGRKSQTPAYRLSGHAYCPRASAASPIWIPLWRLGLRP
jgi:hypothetical protein